MVISPRHAILMDSINQTYVVAIDGLVWRVTLIIFLVERKDIRRIPLKYPDFFLTGAWKGIRVAYDKRTPEGLVPVETLVKTAFEESGFRCNSEATVDSRSLHIATPWSRQCNGKNPYAASGITSP